MSIGALVHKRPSECRVCGSELVIEVGEVEFYSGYALPIYDCNACGCRFAPHDESTYDYLYSEQRSCYNLYSYHAESCKARFDAGDLAGLRAELSKTLKYRFIIDQIKREKCDARILEIGCSRGHLSSYFILDGRNITAVDVSQTAIAAARKAFGDHFALAGDPSIEARAPYDIIFHVGTIGCVSDPVGMTRGWLDMLKPGGRLLFNAPNRNACALSDQLWFKSAPPPDVVTLFPPGFWQDCFSYAAHVEERIEFCSPEQNVSIFLRRLGRRKWQKPVPISIEESGHLKIVARRSTLGGVRRNLARAVIRVAAWTGVRFAPQIPSEYGLFVQMTKK